MIRMLVYDLRVEKKNNVTANFQKLIPSTILVNNWTREFSEEIPNTTITIQNCGLFLSENVQLLYFASQPAIFLHLRLC